MDRKKRYSGEQNIGFLKEAESGVSVKEPCRRHGFSEASFYRPRPDRSVELRQKIIALAQRHRRYGAAIIYLKLRQWGELVNHKRVEPLYAAEKLQIKRRRRKKVPITGRQPLERPDAPNGVWSRDIVLDCVAGGRRLKVLGIIHDGRWFI